ncbi:MAG: ABC transporter permease [Saprospiraceae bacterium]|nr:ABC transporter permease [Saprospiraceae bacterium]
MQEQNDDKSRLTQILPPGKFQFIDFNEVYRYRALLVQLAYKDFKVRYVQTYLGGLWAIINPLISMLLLYFVFGRLAKVDTLGIPAGVFVMSGLVIWTFYSTLLPEAGNSIVSSHQMIKKIYFPRILLPAYKAINALVDTAVAMIILLMMMLFLGLPISHRLFYLPLPLGVMLISGAGMGFLVAALAVNFRDFQHILPHVIRLGIFICPVAYPASLVPDAYAAFYFVNPVAGITEVFRWCLFDDYILSPNIWISMVSSFILFIAGLTYFSRTEKTMADLL